MIRAVLTDIEGTTSSISFVHDVLFPYARDRIGEFVRRHKEEPAVLEQLEAVSHETGQVMDMESVIEQLQRWIDEDRKITPLKMLQGMIWEAGYEKGDFTGHIYPDAAQYLQQWASRGIALYVYSSGSVKAQQLLFGHSDVGDLTPLFKGYYDTRIGHKRDADAYQAIAREMDIAPQEILFLSDIEEELDAARKANMQTMKLVREDKNGADKVHDTSSHAVAHNFAEVDDLLAKSPPP